MQRHRDVIVDSAGECYHMQAVIAKGVATLRVMREGKSGSVERI